MLKTKTKRKLTKRGRKPAPRPHQIARVPVTDLEYRFLTEYCATWNGQQAYMLANPTAKPSTARREAAKILIKPHVKRAVMREKRRFRDRAGVDALDVLYGFINIANADIGDVLHFAEDGTATLRPGASIPPRHARRSRASRSACRSRSGGERLKRRSRRSR